VLGDRLGGQGILSVVDRLENWARCSRRRRRVAGLHILFDAPGAPFQAAEGHTDQARRARVHGLQRATSLRRPQ
jgi:hypothetical protein